MRALALAVCLALPAAAQPGLELEVFSGVDREAVEAGGYLEVRVEALAVPGSPAVILDASADFHASSVLR